MKKFWENPAAPAVAPPGARCRVSPDRRRQHLSRDRARAHGRRDRYHLSPLHPQRQLSVHAHARNGHADASTPQISNQQSGCGLIMTEFTSADGLSRMRETKRKRYLTYYDDEHPIAAQLFGSNPRTLGRSGADRRGRRLRHGRPEPRLPGQARRRLQWRLRPAARPAADRAHLRGGARRRDDSLHRQVPRWAGTTTTSSACRSRKTGGGVRPERRRAARPHARAGLLRPGALGIHCRGEGRGDDSGDRQRRHPHARRCCRHGGAAPAATP